MQAASPFHHSYLVYGIRVSIRHVTNAHRHHSRPSAVGVAFIKKKTNAVAVGASPASESPACLLQDELHVVFECPRLANLLAQFPRLFTQRVVADKNLRALLQSSEFSSVAHFIALAYEWLLRCRTPP